jgi:hypothetical protein
VPPGKTLVSLNLFSEKIDLREGGQGSKHARERTAYKVFLVGKPERKRPLQKPMQRWVDNIKFIIK